MARALVMRPEIVILDEPTSALDIGYALEILALLSKLQQDLGISYILISHDIRVIKALSDDIMVLDQGKIAEIGKATDILANPKTTAGQLLLSA